MSEQLPGSFLAPSPVAPAPATPAPSPATPQYLVLSKTDTAQKPWYRNPVAIAGYAAQLLGGLMIIATFLQANPIPGAPPWVATAAGLVLALGSYLGLAKHSADVRVAELAASVAIPAG